MTVMSEPEYRFAGFWWRLLAYLIDSFIFWIVEGIIGALIWVRLAASSKSQDGAPADFALFSIIWVWLYYALLEGSYWRATPGKKACGLIVTDKNGERISCGRAIGRHFAKFLSALILMNGFIMAGCTRRKQALHDLICGTLVLKKTEFSARINVPRAA